MPSACWHRPRCGARSRFPADGAGTALLALQRVNVIIAAYQDFLDQVRGRDDVSFALVVGLLAVEAHRRADIEAALAKQVLSLQSRDAG